VSEGALSVTRRLTSPSSDLFRASHRLRRVSRPIRVQTAWPRAVDLEPLVPSDCCSGAASAQTLAGFLKVRPERRVHLGWRHRPTLPTGSIGSLATKSAISRGTLVRARLLCR